MAATSVNHDRGRGQSWLSLPFLPILPILIALLVPVPPGPAAAENLTHSAKQSDEAQALKVVIGKSVIIDVPMAIKRASLANPEIADAIVLSPKQIYIAGKGFGTTNLTLWGKDEQVFTIFDLEVQLDVSRLREQLRQLFPDEPNIHATAVHDHITLWGTISTSEKRVQAFAVAEAYAPKKVVNFLHFDPPKPVVDQAPKPVMEPAPKPAADKTAEKAQSVVIELIRGTSVTQVTTK